MNFWLSGTGTMPTGLPQDSFVSDFSVIPEGTQARATVKDFLLVEKNNQYTGELDKYYQVTFKITDGDFINREINLKIKCFSGQPNTIQRNLSMLMLVLKLCDFKPTHNNAPESQELAACLGKIVSIKIGEYSINKEDGGVIEGNFVREVHKAGDVETETGIKVVRKTPESALTRNADRNKSLASDQDIPF